MSPVQVVEEINKIEESDCNEGSTLTNLNWSDTEYMKNVLLEIVYIN